MKTKYIKIPITEKHVGKSLTCVNKSGIISVGTIHQSRLDYSFTCISSIHGEKEYSYDVTHYLQEVPDYEDEMMNVLEFLIHLKNHKEDNGKTDYYNEYRNQGWFDAEQLLTKIKQS